MFLFQHEHNSNNFPEKDVKDFKFQQHLSKIDIANIMQEQGVARKEDIRWSEITQEVLTETVLTSRNFDSEIGFLIVDALEIVGPDGDAFSLQYVNYEAEYGKEFAKDDVAFPPKRKNNY